MSSSSSESQPKTSRLESHDLAADVDKPPDTPIIKDAKADPDADLHGPSLDDADDMRDGRAPARTSAHPET